MNWVEQLAHFYIIASFAPLPNTKIEVLKQKPLNMVSSIVWYTKDIDFNKLLTLSNFMDKNTSFFKNNKYIVINVSQYVDMKIKLKHNSPYIKVVDIHVYYLIKLFQDYLNYNYKKTMYAREYTYNKHHHFRKVKSEYELDINYYLKIHIFNLFLKKTHNRTTLPCAPFYFKPSEGRGPLDEKEQSVENISDYNVIFIFNDIIWSNIVLMFKSINIQVYGGSGTKRHLLSTVQARLTGFLYLLNDMNIDKSIIYESFNKPSAVNSKITKKIDGLKHNLTNWEKFKNELPVSIYNTSDENINFFWHLNLIPNIISTILKLINEQKLILKKIDDISKNILTDQERHKKYSSAHLNSDWSEKKLRNIDKNNILNLESIKENKKKLELLLLDINYHTDNLYKLDKNLFDSNGICKLYSEIKKSDVL